MVSTAANSRCGLPNCSVAFSEPFDSLFGGALLCWQPCVMSMADSHSESIGFSKEWMSKKSELDYLSGRMINSPPWSYPLHLTANKRSRDPHRAAAFDPLLRLDGRQLPASLQRLRPFTSASQAADERYELASALLAPRCRYHRLSNGTSARSVAVMMSRHARDSGNSLNSSPRNRNL